jgi:hypothetical protein
MEEAFERLSDMYSIEVQAMPPALAYSALLCCAERGDMCSAAAARAFPRWPIRPCLALRMSIPSAATHAPMSLDGLESSGLLDGPTSIWLRPAGRAVNQLCGTFKRHSRTQHRCKRIPPVVFSGID